MALEPVPADLQAVEAPGEVARTAGELGEPPPLPPLPALTDPAACRALLKEWRVDPDIIDQLNGTTLDQLAFLRPADLAQAGIPLEEAGWLIAKARRHRADLLRQPK